MVGQTSDSTRMQCIFQRMKMEYEHASINSHVEHPPVSRRTHDQKQINCVWDKPKRPVGTSPPKRHSRRKSRTGSCVTSKAKSVPYGDVPNERARRSAGNHDTIRRRWIKISPRVFNAAAARFNQRHRTKEIKSRGSHSRTTGQYR